MTEIPETHPRQKSLMLRESLVRGFADGIVAQQGLIAHGRGEMFYYLLGERTIREARIASRAAAALLLKAERPVISVNGNVAALCPKAAVTLANAASAKVEVGLFHRSDERLSKIQAVLEREGATQVLGFLPDERIPGLEGSRGLCTREGIFTSDVVLVALEDGDRTEALVRMGKKVIAIDLNPFSRTARSATVAIIDEVTEALPLITGSLEEIRGDSDEIDRALERYNREENLGAVMRLMASNLGIESSESSHG
ncbi:MAG: phosphopantothenate/pantothenate synthetase [Methanobacteriota archaeon]|nr:MAG: phosphopantothenate/pantothenate synthetase [Euryarchaeota archaeon]